MLDEARKREKVANAFLAATMAASAAQSPKDFVRTGHIEAPGTVLMQRWGHKRAEAERNLDQTRVSQAARNKKIKTFREFVEEAYLIEKTFSSRAEAEAHYGKDPKYTFNNAGSSENPRWRRVLKSNRSGQSQRRKDAIASLNTDDERNAAKRKERVIQSKGYEAHHITPLHHSRKLKSSMSDAEWKERVERDRKLGVYHGHQPRNLMAARGKNTPSHKKGVEHRAGGAHEVEGKVKDIVSGPGSKESAISHRDLLAAAVRKKRREAKKK